jgi:hypothetical protein
VTITNDRPNLVGTVKPLWIIIAQFAPKHQNALLDLEQLLNCDLTAWSEQLDAEYAALQQLDATLRRALGDNPGPDKHDTLIALSDCIHQRMTDIETKLKLGPDWLLYGGDDE